MDLNFLFEAPEIINLSGNWIIFAIAIILIIATIAILLSLKEIIINSVLGLIAWGIVVFVFNVSLPLIPSLVVSIIFGLAGVGVMLLLAFFGVLG